MTNSPHSPLVLEITGPWGGNGESTQLVAYHYRFVEDRLFRETEMAFEVRQEGNRFALKAIRYLPANPQYLKAFAMVAELSLHGEALKAVIRKNGWSLPV